MVLRKKEIVEEIFTVSGRKYPLLHIREQQMREHEAQGLIRDHSITKLEELSNEELARTLEAIGEARNIDDSPRDELINILKGYMTKRHIIIWQDHSSMANHGHILLMIRIAYDPAVYYTPSEMFAMMGENIDVQEIVERPQVYLLARARDTVLDKLSYVQTRVDDIRELSTRVKSKQGAEFTDVMRFFCGDHPEMAFEKGQQEGGGFPCVGCRGHAKLFHDIEYSYRQDHLTMEQHRQEVQHLASFMYHPLNWRNQNL